MAAIFLKTCDCVKTEPERNELNYKTKESAIINDYDAGSARET